jgi:hypothetical protein
MQSAVSEFNQTIENLKKENGNLKLVKENLSKKSSELTFENENMKLKTTENVKLRSKRAEKM